jgi:glycosyltransferase involved in cell wall biosynthesis
MRIIIATGLYPPESGGPATYSKALENFLPKEGIDVEVIPFSTIRRYPKVFRHLFYFFKIFTISANADIVYALDPVSVGLPTYLASIIRGKKFLLRIAGDYAWEQGVQRFGVEENLDDFVMRSDYCWQVRLLRKIQIFIAKKAIKVVVPSGYLKKIVTAWGVEKNKIEVIYNAVDKIFIPETKEELKKRFGFSNHALVSVGRLVPWKGYMCLIELMPKLIESYPDAELRIVGDGPDYDRLLMRIKELKLEKKVFLLGRKEKHELSQIISGSDVFVLNTGYEGLSHQLLEVMQLRVPLVTTSIGGNVELIKNEQSGLLVHYNNSDEIYREIVRYFENEDLRLKVEENAYKQISEEFSYEAFLGNTITFFKKIRTF